MQTMTSTNSASGFGRHVAIAAASFLAASSLTGLAWAADPFTIQAKSDLVAPEAPGAHVLTFYIDVAPGGVIPYHHHEGRSVVLIVDGVLNVSHKDGSSASFGAGQTFVEEIGDVHTAAASADGPVHLVWTIVLPDGAQLMPFDG